MTEQDQRSDEFELYDLKNDPMTCPSCDFEFDLASLLDGGKERYLSPVTPRVINPEYGTGQFGVIMEDLGLRSARFPNATTPVSIDEMRGLVTTLATLHAHYWQSPRFEADLRWIATPCSPGTNGLSLPKSCSSRSSETSLENRPWASSKRPCSP